MKADRLWKLCLVGAMLAFLTGGPTGGSWADTVELQSGFTFVCKIHPKNESFGNDPEQWLEFEIGYWTLDIPRDMVKSATEDDLYKPPPPDDVIKIVKKLIEEKEEYDEQMARGGAEQIAALAAEITYLVNFAEYSSPGQSEQRPAEEGTRLPEGSALRVKRNSRAELEIGRRTRVGVRAGSSVELKTMKNAVQGDKTTWRIGLGVPVGGIWIEVAGLEPGEKMEMNIVGCSFQVAGDSLISVTSALATGYAIGYWRGTGDLTVNALDYFPDSGGFSLRQGYMEVFSAAGSSGTVHRLPPGGAREWEQWREFKPVTFELEPRLIVPPLESLPSEGVVPSLRKAQVIGSVDIRGEIRSNLLQDLGSYEEAIEAFREDTGRYPTAEEGLEALRTDPEVEGWDGPYVSAEVQPMDPWNQAYRYRLLGSGESVKPVVYSTGQNEIDEYGLGDDVR